MFNIVIQVTIPAKTPKVRNAQFMSGTKAVDTIPLANINDPVNIATRQLNLVITMLTMGPETDIQRLGLSNATFNNSLAIS